MPHSHPVVAKCMLVVRLSLAALTFAHITTARADAPLPAEGSEADFDIVRATSLSAYKIQVDRGPYALYVRHLSNVERYCALRIAAYYAGGWWARIDFDLKDIDPGRITAHPEERGTPGTRVLIKTRGGRKLVRFCDITAAGEVKDCHRRRKAFFFAKEPRRSNTVRLVAALTRMAQACHTPDHQKQDRAAGAPAVGSEPTTSRRRPVTSQPNRGTALASR